jgi:hypothetical protein
MEEEDELWIARRTTHCPEPERSKRYETFSIAVVVWDTVYEGVHASSHKP